MQGESLKKRTHTKQSLAAFDDCEDVKEGELSVRALTTNKVVASFLLNLWNEAV